MHHPVVVAVDHGGEHLLHQGRCCALAVAVPADDDARRVDLGTSAFVQERCLDVVERAKTPQ